MVEEIFEIWHSEMLQIDLILLLFDNYYFVMGEENFEIWFSETLQIEFFPLPWEEFGNVSIQFCIRRDPTPRGKVVVPPKDEIPT